MASLAGKNVVITGGTGGLGLQTALALAPMGARLVLIGRDPGRGKAALDLLRRRFPGAAAETHLADLSRLDEVRRIARTLGETLERIDVLVNNAGAIFNRRELTEDGLERTFALNHMGYFLLTELLWEKLLRSAPARIVNVASEAHRGARLDFSDLQSAKSYGAWKAYRRSKLCNILFTRELARRLAGTGVTANCVHPGFCATGFGNNTSGWFRRAGGARQAPVRYSAGTGCAYPDLCRGRAGTRGCQRRLFHRLPGRHARAGGAGHRVRSQALGRERAHRQSAQADAVARLPPG